LLVRVVAEVREGENYDRQSWPLAVAALEHCLNSRVRTAVDSSNRRDKAVAAARDCLDAAAVRAILIEDTPQRRDLDRQVVVFDRDPGPCGGHDLIARDEIARPL